MLYRYEYDTRIYSISGFNQQNEWYPDVNDYFFSRLGNCWGWASWKRCWQDYDVEIKDFDDFKKYNGFENSLGKDLGKIKNDMIYNGIVKNQLDSWALQWGYLRHKNSGLTCIPSKSLIMNIGFGEDATHTKDKLVDKVSNHDINFPTKINKFVVPDYKYDSLMFKRESLISRALKKLRSILRGQH